MNPHLTQILATERQRDLERAAGCCTPMAEHLQAVRRPIRNRVWDLSAARRPTVSKPNVCCG